MLLRWHSSRDLWEAELREAQLWESLDVRIPLMLLLVSLWCEPLLECLRVVWLRVRHGVQPSTSQFHGCDPWNSTADVVSL